jgi:glucose-1-phosphate thymidylyltransferase
VSRTVEQAVVMAAGEGHRLRPLTERYAKAVLPIDGRPVVVGVVHELRLAGIERITVVTGHLAEQVETLLASFPAELRFVRQPRADGSADAVRRAALEPPYLVLGADTAFTPGDVGRFCAAAEGHDGAVAVRRRPPPGPGRSAVRIEGGLVTCVLDPDPGNPLAGAPLWLFGERVNAHLDGLPGPPFENAAAVQRAIEEGARVAGIEIGPTRDLTDPFDLVEENFGYLKGL